MSLLPGPVGDIVQLLGALGLGSAGGWISGGVSAVWKAKHDRRTKLDEERRIRIAKWRDELTAAENVNTPTAALDCYYELREYLSPEYIKHLEVWELGRSAVAFRGNSSVMALQEHHELLKTVADLERRWGLI